MISGRHEQVGRPFHLLAQTVQYGRRRLGNPFMGIALSGHARKRTEPVMTVGKPP
jgi:hypothetical protein